MDKDFDRHGHPKDLSPWPQRTQRASPPQRYRATPSDRRPPSARPYYHEDRQQQQQRPPYHPEEYPVETDVDNFDRHPRRISREESWQGHHRQQPVLDRRDRQLQSFSPADSLGRHSASEATPAEQEHHQRAGPPRLAPHLWQDSTFVPSQYNDQPRHSAEPEDDWVTGMLLGSSSISSLVPP